MLPNTLSGLAGFIIFVVLVLGMTAPDLFPSHIEEITTTQNNIALTAGQITNNTAQGENIISDILGVAGLDGIYNIIFNILYITGAFVVLMFEYVTMFLGIALIVPTEFYVFFAIIGMSTIIALVKLIFLAGD